MRVPWVRFVLFVFAACGAEAISCSSIKGLCVYLSTVNCTIRVCLFNAFIPCLANRYYNKHAFMRNFPFGFDQKISVILTVKHTFVL